MRARKGALDPIRTLADCDASRFEDDILATWYCYQSAKRPFLPELRGQKRSPPEVRNAPSIACVSSWLFA
jgi:hypothetical protein